MPPSMLELCSLLWLLISPAVAQQPQDPLKDFCRRYGHQTAIIDRKLYIDGGWVYANPIPQNPIPTINQGLLYSDLEQVRDGMPPQYANLSKNSTVPDVSGGTLWPDEVNKVFWLYGGEFSSAPSTFQLWGYDTLLNQWNLSSASTASASAIQRVAYGAGASLNNKGYYYGGYLNSLTNPLWTGPPLATSGLTVFDMDANTLTNNTGPDDIGRAEGVMVSIPASASGLLIYFGGVAFPKDSNNSSEVAMSMAEIMVYDVGDSKWYTQKTTGQIPENRRKFCAGSTWTEDQTSYNIYIYGGFGFGENATGFDDVYILTLPTFEWIKWYPEAPGAGAPHGLLTCNVIDHGQMMVMGGNFTNTTSCDVPSLGAQHNLNLGQVNVENSKWFQYLPNLTTYEVPPAIQSVVGGSADGGATSKEPAGGWSDSALAVYFGAKAQFDERTPTRYIPPTATASVEPTPTPAAEKSHTGAIVGGAVGGVVALIIFGVAIFFYLRRRKAAQGGTQNTSSHPPNNVLEAPGSSSNDDKIPMVRPKMDHSSRSNSQISPPYSPPQMGPFGQYQQQPYPYPQPFYPGHMQQQNYGIQQMYSPLGGPQAVEMYTQQPQYLPQEMQATSPSAPQLPHEMPTNTQDQAKLGEVNRSVPQRVLSPDVTSETLQSQTLTDRT